MIYIGAETVTWIEDGFVHAFSVATGRILFVAPILGGVS